MIKLAVLFPDPDYKLVACLCYLLIFLTAYKRYDSLIINFGPYDAPKTARPWTTWLRYHGSAVIYSCMYLIFFAILYQLFSKHPTLVSWATDFFGKDNTFIKALGGIDKDLKLISPILALILLTWGAEKYRKATAADRKLRYYFQQLGSIPGSVALTIRKLKKYELKVSTNACTDNLSEEMNNEIMLPILQEDPRSLEHLYLRACHLFYQIDHWNSISSDFFQFQTAYHQAFENIKRRFEKLSRNANRYYQLKLKFAADAHYDPGISEEMTMSRFNYMYPKVLTELRKDLKNDLKSILENIYIYIACAVHSKGFTAKKRKKLLQSFGFIIDNTKRRDSEVVDPNDMTILAIFLVFVIPLSAAFARLAGNTNAEPIESIKYVVWSVMALFVGLTSVAIPILIKQTRETSESHFWKRLRPQKGHSWCSYLISGIIAGAVGIFGMFMLNFLSPGDLSRSLPETLARFLPWGLVPLSVALVLGYHLDRETTKGKHTVAIEALTTALSAVLGALLALAINAENIQRSDLKPIMYFSLSAAALLGCTIGAVIPQRCRKKVKNRMNVSVAEVNLKAIIQNCVNNFIERADKGNVKITATVAENIPVVNVDPVKIKHAINGLISNALEFTPEEGTISISAGRLGRGGITFSVKDNGIGMSSHKIKTIVDAPPGKLHSAWEQVGECPNADLIQVRSIAEKHGGKFILNSQQWVGTEVIVEFPQERICAAAAMAQSEHPRANSPTPMAA
jgi:hypothetical protein